MNKKAKAQEKAKAPKALKMITPKVAEKVAPMATSKAKDVAAPAKVVSAEAFAKGVEALREASRARAKASRAKNFEAVGLARKAWIAARKAIGLTLQQAIEAQKQKA